MSIDPKLAEAIRHAVEETGQSDSLSRKLNAWLSALVDGNEDINDPSQADRHLELIYEAVRLDDEISSDAITDAADEGDAD